MCLAVHCALAAVATLPSAFSRAAPYVEELLQDATKRELFGLLAVVTSAH